MTRMLDIVQDYLDLREYPYERLDGSVRGTIPPPFLLTFLSTFLVLLVFLLSPSSSSKS